MWLSTVLYDGWMWYVAQSVTGEQSVPITNLLIALYALITQTLYVIIRQFRILQLFRRYINGLKFT